MPAKIKRNLITTVILFIILVGFIYYIAMPDHPRVTALAISYVILLTPATYADEYARYYKKNNSSPALVYKWQKRSSIPVFMLSLIYLIIIFSFSGALYNMSILPGIAGIMTGMTIGSLIKFFKARSAYRRMLSKQSRDYKS